MAGKLLPDRAVPRLAALLRAPTLGQRRGGLVGEGGAGTALKFAKISGHAGTEPPYLYSGVEVQHDGSSDFEPENFEEVSGGDDLANKLISLSEIGTGGIGVGPLEEDSIVSYWAMGAKFACVGVNYKGTY